MVNHQLLTKNENLQIEFNKGVQLDVFLVKVDKVARSDDTVHGGADLVLLRCKQLEAAKKKCDEKQAIDQDVTPYLHPCK